MVLTKCLRRSVLLLTSSMYQKAVKFIQLFMFLNFSDQRIQLPEWALDSKLIRRGKRSVHCVLVKWISLPDNMATREDLST
jgi:hypothetical protein